MPAQVAQTLLRYCGVPKLSYLARTVRPELLAKPSRDFDAMVMRTLLNKINISQQTLRNAASDPSSDAYVTEAQLRSRIALPIKLGGFGIRSIAHTRHAAYFAAHIQMLPEYAALYPDTASSKFADSALHTELEECRQQLLSLSQSLTPTDVQPSPPGAATQSARPHTSSPFNAPRYTLKSIDDVWKQAACLASQKEKTPFAPAYKLQHNITHSVELEQFRSLYASCKPYQRVILTSLSKTAASSCFMTAL